MRTGDDPLEIGIDRYIRLTGPGRFLNHSCEPTAGLSGERDLVALVDLAEGHEITVDYSTNASSRHGYRMRFTCACGAAGCRGEIGDLSTLPPGRLRFYLESGALQDYLLDEARELLAATGD